VLIDALNDVSFLKNPEIKVVVVSNSLTFLASLNFNGYQVAYEINDDFDFLTIQPANSFIEELIVKNKNISAEQISNYQSAGIAITIFEMRSTSGIRKALRKNPNTIITDDLREAIIEVN
jgi:hypothetical protein